MFEKFENFNKVHPELREGEQFYKNMLPSETIEDFEDDEHFDNMRIGRTAYTAIGEKIDSFTPIFIKT